MDKKGNNDRTKRNTAPDSSSQFDPLKDNPEGETVCSPHFSEGCINEATDTPKANKKRNKNEKH